MTEPEMPRKRDPLSILSLVIGLVALALCVFVNFLATVDNDLSILFIAPGVAIVLAVVFGHASLGRIRRTAANLAGRRPAIGGLVLGYAAAFGVLLWIFGIFALPTVILAINTFRHPPNYEVTLEIKDIDAAGLTLEQVKRSVDVLSARMADLGMPGRVTQAGARIVRVQFRIDDCSKETSALAAFDQMVKPCILSFHLVHADSDVIGKAIDTGAVLPKGFKVVQFQNEPLVLEVQASMVDDVAAAKVIMGRGSRPSVQIRLGPKGAGEFARLTSANVGRRLVIMIDDTVYIAPKINTPITGGSILLEGDFTTREAVTIARSLGRGVLPFSMVRTSERFIQAGGEYE